MPYNNIGQRLRECLLSQGVQCEPGLSDERIIEFECRYNIRMPPDLRSYFIAMDGSAGNYAFGIIRFWKLDELKTIATERRITPHDAAVIVTAYDESVRGANEYFLFADCLHEAQLYALRLSKELSQPNQVILLDGSDPVRVADSFSQFVDRYITSPEQLRLVTD